MLNIPVLPSTGGHVRPDEPKKPNETATNVILFLLVLGGFVTVIVWLIVLPILGITYLMTR